MEVATGAVLGDVGCAPGARGGDLRAAVEAAVRRALRQAPCVVAFSGGRDSSIVLALALAVARREGLPLPIPITLEFDGEGTRESDWQERVIAHLEVDEWVRVPLGEELDLLGDVATAGLRRHGLLYPANAHFIVPLASAAAGGSLLTGLAGDSVFGEWPWNDVARLLAGHRRPRPRDARRVVHWLAPGGARVLRCAASADCRRPWLHGAFGRRATLRLAQEAARTPRTWPGQVRAVCASRAWRLTEQNVSILAADHGAGAHAPFLDPAVLEALAVSGGRWGWGNRTATLKALFSDLLPDWILERTSKAEFSQPFFSANTRRFARAWDGRTGVDETAIDGEVLRATWLADRPNFQSSTLLQATWLAVEAHDRASSRPSSDHAP